jgi:hypothetical protein
MQNKESSNIAHDGKIIHMVCQKNSRERYRTVILCTRRMRYRRK